MSLEELQKKRKEENDLFERVVRNVENGSHKLDFPTGGVPTEVAAEVFGKAASLVIRGIELGLLPIGIVTRESSRANVYISPKLLYEYTGFVWEGER